MERKPGERRKSRARRRSGRQPYGFRPAEPAILAGQFVGKRLSELSDEELAAFLRTDAWRQLRWVTPLLPQLKPCFLDMSQYWFAKYELERRKPDTQRTPTSLDISPNESRGMVAQKLAEYGFKAASRMYHPDRGGSTVIMQLLNEAREFAKERLKS